MPEYNTLEPILVLIRRGRNGRGFSVAPVEDLANPALCADGNEMGEVIIEMLNDTNQPRVDVNSLLGFTAEPGAWVLGSGQDSASNAGQGGSTRQHHREEYDEASAYEEDDYGQPTGVQGDFADQLLFQALNAVIGKGRSMSSARVRPSGPRRKKRT